MLQANEKGDIVIVWITLLQPKSVGFIELKSASPDVKPRIVPNYYHNEYDINTMVRATKQQMTLTKTAAFRKNMGIFVRLPLSECDELDYISNEY